MIPETKNLIINILGTRSGQADSPEVVEVVELGWRQEGEVVSTVGDSGADQSHAVPHGGGGQVGAQDHRPDYYWQRVGDLTAKKKSIQVLMSKEFF